MLDSMSNSTPPGAAVRVGMVSTFPPTRCGIGRFAASMVDALERYSPSLDVDIVRLVDRQNALPTPSRVQMEIDPDSSVSVRAAGRHLNRCDVVIFQHEYGIFGGDDGRAVLDLARLVERPIISVLHTVVPRPTESQRGIIESLAEQSRLVVLCESARDFLASSYGIPHHEVVVIPHGAQWGAQPVNPGPRRNLITWGLLGPGKGLERSLHALSQLRDLDPAPTYRIVGRTHPSIARAQGYGYRESLERLVTDLDIGHMVEFIDRYVDDDDLFDLVRQSDVVVVPYDNSDQVSSGVITEAAGMGRPVVATRFPYAVEVLGTGAGLTVPHDSGAMADAMRVLLVDDDHYEAAARESSRLSESFSWAAVASRYATLIDGHVTALATA